MALPRQGEIIMDEHLSPVNPELSGNTGTADSAGPDIGYSDLFGSNEDAALWDEFMQGEDPGMPDPIAAADDFHGINGIGDIDNLDGLDDLFRPVEGGLDDLFEPAENKDSAPSINQEAVSPQASESAQPATVTQPSQQNSASSGLALPSGVHDTQVDQTASAESQSTQAQTQAPIDAPPAPLALLNSGLTLPAGGWVAQDPRPASPTVSPRDSLTDGSSTLVGESTPSSRSSAPSAPSVSPTASAAASSGVFVAPSRLAGQVPLAGPHAAAASNQPANSAQKRRNEEQPSQPAKRRSLSDRPQLEQIIVQAMEAAYVKGARQASCHQLNLLRDELRANHSLLNIKQTQGQLIEMTEFAALYGNTVNGCQEPDILHQSVDPIIDQTMLEVRQLLTRAICPPLPPLLQPHLGVQQSHHGGPRPGVAPFIPAQAGTPIGRLMSEPGNPMVHSTTPLRGQTRAGLQVQQHSPPYQQQQRHDHQEQHLQNRQQQGMAVRGQAPTNAMGVNLTPALHAQILQRAAAQGVTTNGLASNPAMLAGNNINMNVNNGMGVGLGQHNGMGIGMANVPAMYAAAPYSPYGVHRTGPNQAPMSYTGHVLQNQRAAGHLASTQILPGQMRTSPALHGQQPVN